MRVVDKILRLHELEAEPPVLVDVGAAQGIHPPWRRLAKYSVCVAFEADKRELESVTSEASGFRRLTTYNAIAAERSAPAEPFHLTASPFCSSRLAPRLDLLGRYAFAPLFEVEQTVELPALGLSEALADLGLERVDWIKIDSQGTDLRLFRSLSDELARTVLVAEFEPGIIDAYEDEDLLSDLLAEMRGRGFWVSEMTVRGSTRIDNRVAQRMLGPAEAVISIAARRPRPAGPRSSTSTTSPTRTPSGSGNCSSAARSPSSAATMGSPSSWRPGAANASVRPSRNSSAPRLVGSGRGSPGSRW